jgi:hypothetical protein
MSEPHGVLVQATGAEEQQSTSQLPPHPDDVAEPTKQYVESIVKFLRQQNGRFNMSRLGIELKRPVGALKIGRILKTYESWFRRSGMKGVVLRTGASCKYIEPAARVMCRRCNIRASTFVSCRIVVACSACVHA